MHDNICAISNDTKLQCDILNRIDIWKKKKNPYKCHVELDLAVFENKYGFKNFRTDHWLEQKLETFFQWRITFFRVTRMSVLFAMSSSSNIVLSRISMSDRATSSSTLSNQVIIPFFSTCWKNVYRIGAKHLIRLVQFIGKSRFFKRLFPVSYFLLRAFFFL